MNKLQVHRWIHFKSTDEYTSSPQMNTLQNPQRWIHFSWRVEEPSVRMDFKGKGKEKGGDAYSVLCIYKNTVSCDWDKLKNLIRKKEHLWEVPTLKKKKILISKYIFLKVAIPYGWIFLLIILQHIQLFIKTKIKADKMPWAGFEPQTLRAASSDEDHYIIPLPLISKSVLIFSWAQVFHGNFYVLFYNLQVCEILFI